MNDKTLSEWLLCFMLNSGSMDDWKIVCVVKRNHFITAQEVKNCLEDAVHKKSPKRNRVGGITE